MADANIRAVITAKDDASNVLKSFGDNASSVGSKIIDVAKVAAVSLLAVGTAAVGAGAVSVKAYTESEDALAQMTAALKSTHDASGLFEQDLIDQANALEKLTTYSHVAIEGVENLLLTFTNIHGAIYQQAVPAILDMATAMHEDLQSASIQVGKALNDPILGITALHRIGVTFSATQKEQIQNFVDTNQLAKAQGVILTELNKEFGGSAEAAGDTFAGALAKLKNSLHDVEEEVGQTIVKYLAPFATKALEAVAAINWDQIIQNTVTALRLLFDTLTGGDPTIKKGEEGFKSFAIVLIDTRQRFLDIYNSIIAVYQQIEQYLNPKLQSLSDSIKGIFPVMRTFIDNFINPLVEALAIASGRSLVWALGEVIDALKETILIATPFFQFLNDNKSTIYSITDDLVAFANSIKDSFVSAFNTIQGAAEILTGAILAVYEVDKFVFGAVIAIFQNLRPAIADIFSSAGIWLYDAGKAIIQGLINGIEDAIGNVGNSLGKVGSDISGAVKSALHAVHIPGFASGVQDFSGGLAVVGEQGPELVNLPQGSSVTPNSKIGSVGGTVNIAVNVGVYAGTQIELRKLATKVMSAYQDAQSMGTA